MLDLLFITGLLFAIGGWCWLCARMFQVTPAMQTPMSAYKILLKRIRGISTVQYMPDMEDMVDDYFHSYHDQVYYDHLVAEMDKRRRELQGGEIIKQIV